MIHVPLVTVAVRTSELAGVRRTGVDGGLGLCRAALISTSPRRHRSSARWQATRRSSAGRSAPACRDGGQADADDLYGSEGGAFASWHHAVGERPGDRRRRRGDHRPRGQARARRGRVLVLTSVTATRVPDASTSWTPCTSSCPRARWRSAYRRRIPRHQRCRARSNRGASPGPGAPS